MILIAGLGNPGLRYRGTRHNMGFAVAETLSVKWNIPLTTRGFFGLYGKGIVAGQKVILLMPQTYMNESGRSVEALRGFYNIEPQSVWIVYDDIDLPVGRLRIRKDGSAGTHNGMRSVIACMGTQGFPRLRVGVGQPAPGWDLADYVLAQPTLEEKEILKASVAEAAEALEEMLVQGVESAMQRANRAGLAQQ